MARSRPGAWSPIPSTVNTGSTGQLQALWRALNARFFRDTLPPIKIEWSPRLTSSVGMFVSRVGPTARAFDPPGPLRDRRLIRLSLPLLHPLSAIPGQAEREVIGTLAHEMIHQWQYDLLKRPPDHGPDFFRKMVAMNREGLGITIRHGLDEAVRTLARYTWQCVRCGQVYERQRRTIRPRVHHCGACRGRLREMLDREGNSVSVGQLVQMKLSFLIP